MKAIVWTKYGSADGLEYREDVETPTPKDDEIQIKVHATTVTAGDCEARSLSFPIYIALPIRIYMGPLRPRDVILGQELAGEVTAIGKDVTQFKVGDGIFGTTGFKFGAYAEYICLPAKSNDGVLAIKPENMSYDEAATIPTGGLEALHFLRTGAIRQGEAVLINGAGGSIGTIGVQLAKHYGAEVTAVDSATKLDLLRSLGADHVIDYQQEDFAATGKTYDVIFDVIGKGSIGHKLKALKPKGRYLLANPTISSVLWGKLIASRNDKQLIATLAQRQNADLIELRDLIEAGTIKTTIDRYYPLAETADAHRYVETGQKKGNVVITVL